MKKFLFIFSLFTFHFSLFTFVKAQNLVPNPSFEYYTQCPWDAGGSGQLNFAYPWQSPTTGTPDLFNSCSSIASSSVPSNGIGYEYAHNGNGYSGIYCYYKWILGREYIQVQLIDSLQKNTIYCVDFYVSLADNSDYAINNIGAFLSTDSVRSNSSLIVCTPQIVNSSANPLTNKTGWTKISGSFIANGGEKYITIGNFNDDANSDTVRVSSNGWNGSIAYYYIDDVSVTKCDTESKNELTIPNAFTPNGDGVNDYFKVTGKNIRTINAKIYNRWGQLLYNWNDINKPWDGKYNNKYVSDGVYFYIINVVFEDGEMQEKHGCLELVK